MKYFVGPQGWECRAPGVGRRWFEPGTLINDSLPQFAFCVGQGPTIDAIAFDQATYNAMIASPVQGGMGYPVWQVKYHLAAGIVPAAGSAQMPDWYYRETYNDGSPALKRAG